MVCRGECSFCLLVCHQFESPEQASASDVADVGMAGKLLNKKLGKQQSHLFDIVQEIVVLDYTLHFKRCSTADWVALVSVAMNEYPGQCQYDWKGLTSTSSTYELPLASASITLWLASTPETG